LGETTGPNQTLEQNIDLVQPSHIKPTVSFLIVLSLSLPLLVTPPAGDKVASAASADTAIHAAISAYVVADTAISVDAHPTYIEPTNCYILF